MESTNNNKRKKKKKRKDVRVVKMKNYKAKPFSHFFCVKNILRVIFIYILMLSSDRKCGALSDEYDGKYSKWQMEFKSPFHAASSSYNKFLIFMIKT